MSTTRPRTNVAILVCVLILIPILLLSPAWANAQWTTPDANQNINNTNSNNVGIGNNAPKYKLDIQGNPNNAQIRFGMDSSDSGGFLFSIQPSHATFAAGASWSNFGWTARALNASSVTSDNGTLRFYSNSGLTPGNSFTPTERMRLSAGGFLGIGTNSPAHALDLVAASPWIARFKKTDSSNGGIVVESASGFNPNIALAVNGTNKWYLLNNATGSDALQFWESSGSFARFTLTQAGTVGIGTPTPNATYKLDVQNGSINSSGGLCIAGDCKTAWSQVGGSQWSNGGGGAINYSGGSVGIGITSPLYSLDVNGGLNGFRAKAATSSSNDSIATFENVGGVQVIVRGNGNVGIGTTNPSNKLHVAGSITVDGNINAKYQDVAEWVDSSQELPAGTVVVLDSKRSNQVLASTNSYDSRVAGVISAQPGLTLGEAGEGRVLVATTGRVKVKVDASNGPIEIGDLLVTSEKEGVAMKSVPVEIGGVRIHRPGTLIGKALEPLAQGVGEILVLLSLQ